MAKIVIEFDTNEKTAAVSVDGKTVDNVMDVMVFKSYHESDGEFRCSITTVSKDEENDIKTYTQLVASEGEYRGVKPSENFPGLFESGGLSKAVIDTRRYYAQ